MSSLKRKNVSSILYWDVAKIVWGYLVDTPDYAMLVGVDLKSFQVAAAERALKVRTFGFAMYQHFLYRCSDYGCDPCCL